MEGSPVLKCFAVLSIVFACAIRLAAEDSFVVASYNVENYLLQPSGTRPAKAPEARSAVRDMIRSINADVVALQEVGGRDAFVAIQEDLKSVGQVYPYTELTSGHDPHIAVALLSRFPITASRSHTNDSFLLMGRRFHVSRGFLEVDIQPSANYRLTIFSAHLKSRRVVPEADEAEIREQEALLLREKIETRLTTNPKANVLVLGDFNDTKDSRALRALIGRGNLGLIDTRPAEQAESSITLTAADRYDPRTVTWTHYYGKEDTYSRIDYILISRGLFHEWMKDKSYIPRLSNWGAASDHRPVVARFTMNDHGPGTK